MQVTVNNSAHPTHQSFDMTVSGGYDANRICRNALVLANIGETVADVIRNIAGNDIASTLNGESVNRNVIQSLVYSRLANNLKARK